MASLENHQTNPGSQSARLPEGSEAVAVEDTQADALFLNLPVGADRSTHQIFPDQIIGAQFPPAAASAHLHGPDLVLAFANGGSIVLAGFLPAFQSDTPPQLIFEDGTVFTLPNHAAMAAPAPEDAGLSVASGPGDTAPETDPGVSTTENVFGRDQGYGYDFGGIGAGLRSLGTLTTPGFAATDQAAAPNTRPEVQPASDSVPFLTNGSQAQAQPASGNSAPTNVSLSGNSVDELVFIGIPVGTVAATDADPGDNLTFSLSDDAGGRFSIDAVSGLIVTTQPLDFETAASHAVTVRVTDSAGAAVEETFTISVNDLNEITGGAGADTIAGTPQTDVIDGQDGDDNITGGDGSDFIFGGIGRDTLDGQGGDDWLFGEAENDILIGGPGADRLFGGSGNDALIIDASDVFVDGGAGTDRVNVQGAAGVTLNMTASSIELAFGGAGNDVFDATGSSADIRQDGGTGNDTLTGGNGGDRLRGAGGADTLSGGLGNDTIDGGAGNDSLTGGAGADVFLFDLSFSGGLYSAQGNDTIADLTTGDILRFSGVTDSNGDTAIDLADLIGHVTVSSSGGTTSLAFDGGGLIDLEGLSGPFNSFADLLASGYTLEGLA